MSQLFDPDKNSPKKSKEPSPKEQGLDGAISSCVVTRESHDPSHLKIINPSTALLQQIVDRLGLAVASEDIETLLQGARGSDRLHQTCGRMIEANYETFPAISVTRSRELRAAKSEQANVSDELIIEPAIDFDVEDPEWGRGLFGLVVNLLLENSDGVPTLALFWECDDIEGALRQDRWSFAESITELAGLAIPEECHNARRHGEDEIEIALSSRVSFFVSPRRCVSSKERAFEDDDESEVLSAAEVSNFLLGGASGAGALSRDEFRKALFTCLGPDFSRPTIVDREREPAPCSTLELRGVPPLRLSKIAEVVGAAIPEGYFEALLSCCAPQGVLQKGPFQYSKLPLQLRHEVSYAVEEQELERTAKSSMGFATTSGSMEIEVEREEKNAVFDAQHGPAITLSFKWPEVGNASPANKEKVWKELIKLARPYLEGWT